jgi:hypothetical protein
MGVLKPLPLQGRGLERGQSIHSKLFKHPLSRLALKIVVMTLCLRQEARGKSEEGLGDFTFLYTDWFYCVYLFKRTICYRVNR